MTTLREIFARQAKWQRERAQLSWPEKIRLAEVMREALLVLRAGRPPRVLPPEGAPGDDGQQEPPVRLQASSPRVRPATPHRP